MKRRMNMCLEITDLAVPIKLEQSDYKGGLFRVTYGKQVSGHLTYREAAAEFGESIMHALACDGKLDNS